MPTNRPSMRVDMPARLYFNPAAKDLYICDVVQTAWRTNRWAKRVGCRLMTNWWAKRVGCRLLTNWWAKRVGCRLMTNWWAKRVGCRLMTNWWAKRVALALCPPPPL